jgi:Tfp pilus assembly protein FimT
MVELLVALVIIGIMVMTVAPSLQQLLGDNRQVTAAGDLVRIGRLARSRAIDLGVAHMLRFRQAEPANSNLGLIEMYVGMNNKCLQTNWQAAMGMAGQPVAVYDMTEWNPTNGTLQPRANDVGRQVITLRVSTVAADATETARTLLRLCFQPNGDVYTTSADAFDVANDTNAPLVTQRDRARFTIARTIDGVAYGVPRRVLFPTAGSMRFE